METRPPRTTRTTSKTPSKPRLRWPVPADNHDAENCDHRDRAAAEAHHRAAVPPTTAARWLDGERQLLRIGLRQGAKSRSKPFAEVLWRSSAVMTAGHATPFWQR